ncbi:MAG TPA: glycosyltransferase family 2 protein [Armatimonadota bacterium]|nr:glycosyltransferase family 2 protein [Armatimonadota bacterium]
MLSTIGEQQETGGAGRVAPQRQLCLSLIIPAYNERDTIREALQRIRALGIPLEIIVVDDASTDGTRELLEAEPDLVLVKHAVNQGKGMAIRSALERVTGDVVAIQDADLEYEPRDLLRLMAPIARGEARVVYGSRFLGGRPPMQFPNYVCNQLLAWTANILYGARITDEATCYKVFDAALIRSISLECRRFEFCPEVTAKVCKLGERIVEIPISYAPRSYDSGKKIRWSDGVVALWTLIKYRFQR